MTSTLGAATSIVAPTPPDRNLPTFTTVKNLAAALCVTEQTVRNRMDRGEIPFVRFGRSVRIPTSALDELLDPVATRTAERLPDDLADAIERIVAQAPPLSEEQRTRIASILGGAN